MEKVYRILRNDEFLFKYGEKEYFMSREQLKEYLASKIYKEFGDEREAKEIAERKLLMANNLDEVIYKPKSVLEKSNKIVVEKKKYGYYNTYQKAEYFENKTHIEGLRYYNKKNEPANINKLLLHLLENDEKTVREFKLWLSYILFEPERKHETAWILIGEQGSGKGLLRNKILKELLGSNIIEIGQEVLESKYLGDVMKHQIVFANEVFQSQNKFKIPSKLKQLVTDKEISVEEKYKPTTKIINYTNWIFASNESNPLKIDADDRRYYVSKSKKIDKNFVSKLLNTYKSEITCFVQELYELYKQFPDYHFIPYMNQTKQEIIIANKNSVETFIHLIKTNQIKEHILKEINVRFTSNVIKVGEFYIIYNIMSKKLGFQPVGYNKFTIELKKYPNLIVTNEKYEEVIDFLKI